MAQHNEGLVKYKTKTRKRMWVLWCNNILKLYKCSNAREKRTYLPLVVESAWCFTALLFDGIPVRRPWFLVGRRPQAVLGDEVHFRPIEAIIRSDIHRSLTVKYKKKEATQEEETLVKQKAKLASSIQPNRIARQAFARD